MVEQPSGRAALLLGRPATTAMASTTVTTATATLLTLGLVLVAGNAVVHGLPSESTGNCSVLQRSWLNARARVGMWV